MDSSEQRRKRKRLLRPSAPPSFLSLRSFLLCFSFLLFLYLLSLKIPLNSSAFRPVLVVSSFSLMSSSSSSSTSSFRDFGRRFLSPVRIEGRVLFPDHVLFLARKNGVLGSQLECVYYSVDKDSKEEQEENVLSVDDYDESRVIVRCPVPPRNHSFVVNLQKIGRRRRKGLDMRVWRGNNNDNNSTKSVISWENVVYTATMDGDTAVVFVKGLNLRADRESNPRQFTCHFGLGDKGGGQGRFGLMTRAITAAQEVVRCSLPLSVRKVPEKALGVRVTIGMKISPSQNRVLLPSVAKISSLKSDQGRKGGVGNNGRYELCVCTMVWNQAFALREWIMYHAWLGVERWFVYDNNSDDGIKNMVDELEMENFNVTRHVWPWIKTQEAGFSHCALRAKRECNWVSFMDVDEFFYFPYSTPQHQRFRQLGYAGENSLRDLVANFSASSTTLAEIRTACHSYGPSGLNSPPSQGVTVGYTCRLKSPERHKSIIRPDALDTTLLNVVHHFHLKKGFRYLNLPQGTAVINHYKYQVWEVFRAKFFRRVATYVADWQENQNEGSRDRAPGLGTEAIEPPNWHLQFCEVWDTGLRDFVLANFADSSTGLLPWERSPV